MHIKHVVFDVDGTLNTGQFLYDSEKGKSYKVFGPDDNDALKLLAEHVDVFFVSGDKRAFAITQKRLDDMKMDLHLISTRKRSEELSKMIDLSQTIYMGDGIFDHLVFKNVHYSICVSDSLEHVKKASSYITTRKGGERAIAEAVIHILDKFFKIKMSELEF